MTADADSGADSGDERPTVRPVTLARLVETAHLCADNLVSTADIETVLDVSHRRARETILEALRIDLLTESDVQDGDPVYATTHVGEQFLASVHEEDWVAMSDILETRSPHYGAFLKALDTVGPAQLETVLAELEEMAEFTPHTYNQTSVEVVGDWGERLGAVQRNVFTGSYYRVEKETVSETFPSLLLAVYDDLEETAGVDLRQRYLSIPELRETFCERYACRRAAFDDALGTLARQNVGRLELSGAPMDTGAKEAQLGIKEIALADEEGDDGLVSTAQSTERVMAGIEQLGKRYYYLAVHDRELEFDRDSDTTTEHTT